MKAATPALILAALALASAAAAQAPDPTDPRQPESPLSPGAVVHEPLQKPSSPDGASSSAAFGRLDADGDGSISKAEAEKDSKLKAAFKAVDQSPKDGKLSATEFASYELSGAPTAPAATDAAKPDSKKK